jgi:putative serine protease PepD
MSEFSEPPPSDDADDAAPHVEHDAHPSADETPPDAAGASLGHDEAATSGADVPAREPLAGASDNWGSARAVQGPSRAEWPTINSWRVPLVPPPPPPAPPWPGTASARGRGRTWMSVAVVAALIGAVIGGSTAWLLRQSPSYAQVTIRYGTTPPGPAMLASGTSIPRLVDAVSPSVVSVDVTSGFGTDEGTGMIISSNGLVLTNNHVVAALADAGGGQVTVTRTGADAALPATLLGTSPRYDVALLQIQNTSGLPSITFGNSSKLVVGDGVVAIGNALGLAAGTPTVTSGIVSALDRTVTATNSLSGASETLYGMIQTDAAINPGNSGGPLIDSSGQVVGMNTAVAGATSDGSTAQNIGFAIPAARIVHLIPSLISQHLPTTPKPTGGFLGVKVAINSNNVAKHGRVVGAYVAVVISGDPAQKAGMEVGDVIVEIGRTPIDSYENLALAMSTIKPGTTVAVTVKRGSQRLVLDVTVIAPPPGE